MPSFDRLALQALLLAALAAVPTAQTTAQPAAQQQPDDAAAAELATGYEDLVEVSEVSLDVLATGEGGDAVLGLGKDDFEVLEDGQKVEITSVSWASNRYASGEGDAAPGEIPASRYLIFFFHDRSALAANGYSMLRQQLQAARDAVRWVETAMAPSDWAAVVAYDVELRLHQDFTQDRDSLVRALERAASGRKPEDFVPSRREARGRGRELEILSRLPRGSKLKKEARNIYEGLRKVAEASGYLVGRKILLLYTAGFGVRHGRINLPDPRYYPALETELNDHNVAIYPLDLTPSGRPPLEEDFLSRLATDSGGVYDPNISGFFRPLEQITAANTGYYLITYRSARKAGEIGYQRVEVRSADPEIRILARRGYRFGL